MNQLTNYTFNGFWFVDEISPCRLEEGASLCERREAEVLCGRYDAIPCCGGKDYVFGFYPLANEVVKT